MKRFFLIFTLFSVLMCKPQAPAKFLNKYGGTGVDVGHSVLEIYNRQYIVVGSTTSFGVSGTDAYMLLLDSMGQVVWQRTFGGVANEIAKSVVFVPSDSGFVFTGYTNSLGFGGYDVYTVRTDKNGQVRWQNTHGGSDWDFGSDLCIAPDGNIVVCGKTSSYTHGKEDGYLLKFDLTNGSVVWENFFGGVESDEFKKVKSTSDGLITTIGSTKSLGDQKGDFWFFKANINGDSLISKPLGSQTSSETFCDFEEDKDSNLVLCGAVDTSEQNIGRNVSYVVRTTLTGSKITDTKIFFGANDNDEKAHSVTVAKYGKWYYFSRRFNNGGFGIDIQPVIGDYALAFYNATTYGDYRADEAFEMVATSDTGFVMVGYTDGSGINGRDVCVVKSKSNNLVISAAPNPIPVDIRELSTSRSVDSYYFDNKIYLLYSKMSGQYYELIDMSGTVVQKGNCFGNYIEVNSTLVSGSYVFRLNNQLNTQLKFIKE